MSITHIATRTNNNRAWSLVDMLKDALEHAENYDYGEDRQANAGIVIFFDVDENDRFVERVHSFYCNLNVMEQIYGLESEKLDTLERLQHAESP